MHVESIAQAEEPIHMRELFYWSPHELLALLSYYKFAAKMIGPEKRVLDIACGEGLGSWVVAKECGFCTGIDQRERQISCAQKNFSYPSIAFSSSPIEEMPKHVWDGVIYLPLPSESSTLPTPPSLLEITHKLKATGVAIIGIPGQEAAPELSVYFGHVFLFCAEAEMIYHSPNPQPSYRLALCCQPKESDSVE